MEFKRILLKLSGESLMGEKGYGIDPQTLKQYALQIKAIAYKGVEVGIVIGGGNIFRGLSGASEGFDRVHGDQMGMLATVINSIALNSELNNLGMESELFTSTPMSPIGSHYKRDDAVSAMQSGKIAIIAGGTGNPFFTTDTASALRAVEIGAEVMLKGTRVDGIYTADPEKDPTATKFDEISFDDVIEKGLKIMDLTAFAMCKENNLPILVFNMDKVGNLERVLSGDNLGTLVH